jgi:hypothetical protein
MSEVDGADGGVKQVDRALERKVLEAMDAHPNLNRASVRDFCLIIDGTQVILRGSCSSYFCKQLVQSVTSQCLPGGLELVNELGVDYVT